jgi:lipopolysaccharide transport system permease protein
VSDLTGAATTGWTCRTVDGGPRLPLRHRLRALLPLLRVWTEREFRARYRQSALDVTWSVVQPIGVVLIYGFLFSVVLDVSADGLPYLSFAFAGIAGWRFLSFATSASFPSIVEAHSTITKVYFPREVIPLSVVGASLVDLSIVTVILLVVAVAQGVGLSITAVALVPIDLVLVLYVAAACVFGAAISVFVRDVALVLPLVQQLLFVGSPIMYPASLLPDGLQWMEQVNPVAVVVGSTRDAVLHHTWPPWDLLAVHLVVAATLLVLALRYSRSVESQMADVA